jgi:hypothetical protein
MYNATSKLIGNHLFFLYIVQELCPTMLHEDGKQNADTANAKGNIKL